MYEIYWYTAIVSCYIKYGWNACIKIEYTSKNVKLSLCLTKHLATRLRWVVSLSPRSLYSGSRLMCKGISMECVQKFPHVTEIPFFVTSRPPLDCLQTVHAPLLCDWCLQQWYLWRFHYLQETRLEASSSSWETSNLAYQNMFLILSSFQSATGCTAC